VKAADLSKVNINNFLCHPPPRKKTEMENLVPIQPTRIPKGEK